MIANHLWDTDFHLITPLDEIHNIADQCRSGRPEATKKAVLVADSHTKLSQIQLPKSSGFFHRNPKLRNAKLFQTPVTMEDKADLEIMGCYTMLCTQKQNQLTDKVIWNNFHAVQLGLILNNVTYSFSSITSYPYNSNCFHFAHVIGRKVFRGKSFPQDT